MMTPASLYAKVVGTPAMYALVEDKLYPVNAPQAAGAPYIVWARLGSQPMGTLNEAAGNEFTLVQFDIFAPTFILADEIAEALIAALDNSALSTGDIPTYQSRRDSGFDPSVNLYRISIDFLV